MDNNSVNVYPNPVIGSGFNVLFANEGKNRKTELIDIHGSVIQTKMISGKAAFINTQGFTPGIYIIRINLENTVVIKKLVIK